MRQVIVEVVNASNGITVFDLAQRMGFHFTEILDDVRSLIRREHISSDGPVRRDSALCSMLLFPRLIDVPQPARTRVPIDRDMFASAKLRG